MVGGDLKGIYLNTSIFRFFVPHVGNVDSLGMDGGENLGENPNIFTCLVLVTTPRPWHLNEGIGSMMQSKCHNESSLVVWNGVGVVSWHSKGALPRDPAPPRNSRP